MRSMLWFFTLTMQGFLPARMNASKMLSIVTTGFS